jgi:hypothetical protein
VRVRCIQILSTSGWNLGRPIPESPHIAVGEEYPVLSMLIENDPNAAVPRMVQILRDDGPSWWPIEMFVTLSSSIPPNWTVQLRPDVSLHIAPESWLRDGFWEDYFDNPRNGKAAQTFSRETEVIIRAN